MHIGVDATCWHNARGYGRYIRALFSTLVRLDTANHYTFCVDWTKNLDTLPHGAAIRIVTTSAPTTIAASATSRRSVHDMWRMSRAMSSPQFDVLLFPTVYSFVPVLSRARKIVMIMDVIPEKYPGLTLPSRAARLFWNAKVALGRWQADALVTLSDYSRCGIIEQFKIAPEHVFIVGAASDSVFRVLDDPQPTPHLRWLGISTSSRYIVYVGGFNPHKNLEALVAAFAKLVRQSSFSDVQLVMVGEHERESFHSYFATIRQQVERLGISDRVLFTGYLPDEDLIALLNLSTVLALPSLMEGFGLPAIEAAACGCPVIATTASPLPELLGDGELYIDPTRPEELEISLARVLASAPLRQRMRETGLAAARRLTWGAAARQMMKVIHQVAHR